MTTCYFNNSGLPILDCSRRYVFQYVHGLRYVKSQYLLTGNLFHWLMKNIRPGDSLVNFAMFPDRKPPAKLTDNLPDYQVTRIIDIALRATALLAANSGTNVVQEQFFSVASTNRLVTDFPKPSEFQVLDTMTADRGEIMTFPALGEYFVITDYKTTHKRLSDADFHMGYKLSGQFLFYATVLRYAARTGQLSPAYQPFADLLQRSRIAARHLFANYTDKAAEKPQTDQLMLMQPTILSEETLDQFEHIFSQKRDIAAFLTANPHLANPEGIARSKCYGCPYQSICAMGNPLLVETAVKSWPLGSAPYDPTHSDDIES